MDRQLRGFGKGAERGTGCWINAGGRGDRGMRLIKEGRQACYNPGGTGSTC